MDISLIWDNFCKLEPEKIAKTKISDEEITRYLDNFLSVDWRDVAKYKDLLDKENIDLNLLKSRQEWWLQGLQGYSVLPDCSIITDIRIWPEHFFYRFVGGGKVFWYNSASNSFMFPSRHLIIGDSRKFLNFARFCINNFCQVQHIIQRRQKSIGLSLGCSFHHWMHHMLNDLPILFILVHQKLISAIDKIFVRCELISPISELFPEIPFDKIEIVKEIDLISRTLDYVMFYHRNILWKVPNDLRTKFVGIANKKYGTSITRLKHIRKKHYPVILVQIRTAKRVWDSQVDGLIKIIRNLHLVFPRLAVFIDGHACIRIRDLDCINATAWRKYDIRKLMYEEKLIVDTIKHSTEVPIYDLVGQDLFENIFWLQFIDLYVGSRGSPNHKVALLTGKPGVIHSPDYNFIGASWVSKPIYVAGTKINKEFYSCNWEEIYKSIITIIGRIPKRFKDFPML